MKKLIRIVIPLLLVLCMCLPTTALAADTYFLEISIREEANPDKIVKSESVGYLLDSELLAPLVVAAINERYDDGSLEKEFQSPAMRDIMLEGLRAYERKSKDNGASWEAYLAKYYDKVANLDEELDLKGLLIDFSTTIGELELNQVYEMKFKNEVENDPKYGTVYIVSVERKNYSAGHYCPSEVFSDLDTSLWYHEATDYVLLHDMMNGVGDGKFDPNGTTTRAMFVTILWRLEGKPEVEAENLFDDVAEGTWYTEAVIWAADKEVVKGYGNGSFGPDDPITREQLATILYRYSEYKEYDMSAGDSADLSVFTDADTVSDWALSAVKWAYAEKIVEGMGNGLLNPVGHATRAQAAAMLMRYCLNVAA